MRARRATVVDDYIEDGRVAVYADNGMVLVLSEVAGATWSALSGDWTEAREVADILVHLFGPPGAGVDAVDATEGTLNALSEHGLVEIETWPVRRPKGLSGSA